MRLLTATAICALLAACSPSSAPAPEAPAPEAPAADPALAPELAGLTLAPSYVAKTPCPDDGPRFPLSGICTGRATPYMETDGVEPAAPTGCEWKVQETPFADQVLLYRALACGEKKVALEYAGGAHAAELNYTASALHPEAVPGPDAMKPIVRVATYFKDDAARLNETIGSDADIAKCEIRAAGAGYPASAKVIAPKTPGANCGAYALSDAQDNFWIVREAWVYTFMLPRGARDIDPASLTIVAPQ